jgi:hypothetical protein
MGFNSGLKGLIMWEIYSIEESFVALKSSDDSKIDLNMILISGSTCFCCFDDSFNVALNGLSRY